MTDKNHTTWAYRLHNLRTQTRWFLSGGKFPAYQYIAVYVAPQRLYTRGEGTGALYRWWDKHIRGEFRDEGAS